MENLDACAAQYLDWMRRTSMTAFCAAAFVTATLALAADSDSLMPASARTPGPQRGLGRGSLDARFLGGSFRVCRQQMIPGMEPHVRNELQPLPQNFRIAAGLAEGRHRGAHNDGDFTSGSKARARVCGDEDPALEAVIEEAASVIAAAQNPDGYLHTPVLIRRRNGDASAKPLQDRLNFEMYNMGHLLTTACAHHRATGRTNLLAVACKTADFLYEAFREPTPELAKNSVCPSHYMGMIELYRATREPRYLELATKFFAMRDLVSDGGDDNQDRSPFLSKPCDGRGRANYLTRGGGLVCRNRLTACLDPWAFGRTSFGKSTSLAAAARFTTGLPDGQKPSDHAVHQAWTKLSLPNLTAHNETCANIGNVLWNWRMNLRRPRPDSGRGRAGSLQCSFRRSCGTILHVNRSSASDAAGGCRWCTRVPYPFLLLPPNLVRTVAQVANYAYGRSDTSFG